MHTPLLGAKNELRPTEFSQRFIWAAAVIAACLFPALTSAQTQVDDNWTATGSGAWSNAGDWSSGVPNNNSSMIYNVFINNGTSTNASVVSLDTSPTINNLTVGSFDSLMVSTNQTLTVAGSSINNAGTIHSTGTAALQLVIAGSNVTLAGGGVLQLSDSYNSISASSPGNILTNDETIEGAGTIGGGSLVINNSGGEILATGGLLVNVTGTLSGSLAAQGPGSLQINGGSIQNASISSNILQVNVQDSPSVVISNSTINGSSISSSVDAATSAAGTVGLGNDVLNGCTINAALDKLVSTIGFDNVTINGGSLSGGWVTSNGLTLAGSFTNSGSINGNGADITIAGAGVLFATGGEVTNAIIDGGGAGSRLTNQGLIIGAFGEGKGGPLSIGTNGLVVVNSGTIKQGLSTGTLYVQNVTDTNTGTLELSIIGSGTAAITNTGGMIQGVTGGQIENVTITGGTLIGGGTLGSVILDDVTLKGTLVSSGTTVINDGSITGNLQIANDSSLTLNMPTNFTYGGKIQLNASGSMTQLLIGGNMTLSGIMTLSNDSNNVIQGASTGNEVLTNKGTIEGAGNIGNGFMGLVNSGTILANQSTALTIDPSTAGFSNTGKLTVNTGTTLNITGPANSFTDTGTVKVSSGGTLAMGTNLNYTQTKGTTTVDGTLSVASLNSINIQGGTVYGNNGTLDGNLSLSATGVVNPGDGSKKIGDLTIDGAYTQGSKSSLTIDLGGTTANTGYSVLNVTRRRQLERQACCGFGERLYPNGR